ncbi:hypothetical protein AN467_19595 [Pseudomonas aeruginosa]|nr:hypothetical protein AW917_03710 [Pseudomonas aeruginosa]KXE09787.1 hypothetical protein AW918_03860 [Pseudomonas aeruginosa]KXE13407.1 hypothetical protein AW919_03870 [Pseudomonas aeruginosa]KXE23267.1 hypothetical protein AW920_03395 [Pseudomonas aeruginosa]KXE26511.1 hypothetical protein AW921_03855 [Pseudomonas aeruginosa]
MLPDPISQLCCNRYVPYLSLRDEPMRERWSGVRRTATLYSIEGLAVALGRAGIAVDYPRELIE